jgi:hypothetical protein
MRNITASCLLVLLCAPCLAATTYKWVDERGQVHFTDAPPVGVAYEVIPGPSRPSEHAPAIAPSAAVPAAGASPAPTPGTATSPAAAPVVTHSRDDGKCVDALYQIELLGEKRRVFKPGPDGTRDYIDDVDRPGEIERLGRQRDENCSADPAERKAQDLRADQLMQSLSPDCQSAREDLQDMQSPSTRTPDSEIERKRQYVRDHCPGEDRTDLWMADWMFHPRQMPLKE